MTTPDVTMKYIIPKECEPVSNKRTERKEHEAVNEEKSTYLSSNSVVPNGAG